MRVAVALLLVLLSGMAASQPVRFQKRYGGNGNDAAEEFVQTSDGYVLVGFSTRQFTAPPPSSNLSCIYITKIDDTGKVQWARTYGSPLYNLKAYSLLKAEDDGLVICGMIDKAQGNKNQILVLKTDSLGVLQWAREYGGAEQERPAEIKQTSDGYIIAGETSSFGAGFVDAYVIKIDTVGNVIWTRTFGGSGADKLLSVGVAADNSYYFAGGSDSAGYYGGILLQIDASGNLLWCKKYRGNADAIFCDVKADNQKNLIVTGYRNDGTIMCSDQLLMKTDSFGNPIWNRRIDESGFCGYGVSVDVTFDNGYVLTGLSPRDNDGAPDYQDIFLMRTDTDGNVQWVYSFGSDMTDYAHHVAQTADSGFLVSGTFEMDADMLLIKTDAFGLTHCPPRVPFLSASPASFQVTFPQLLQDSGVAVQPYVFTTDSGCITNIICSAAGPPLAVEEQQTRFVLYPNPTTGDLNIQSSASGRLWLFNIHGTFLHSFDLTTGANRITLPAALPSALYIGRFISRDGRVTRGIKIRKE